MIKVTDKHIFFWSGWPSNWYPSIFHAEYEGKKYKFYTSEQYFMFVKAKTFGDEKVAMQIIEKGKDPSVAKGLGRKVKNYDDKVWNEKRYQVMVDACYLKFTKCPKLKDALLDEKYKGRGFVEASPVDRIWGIGIHTNDATDDESTWKGLNLLGKALNEVRERILNEEK